MEGCLYRCSPVLRKSMARGVSEVQSLRSAGYAGHMSYSLNSPKGAYIGDYIGEYYRDYSGSLDYSSCTYA